MVIGGIGGLLKVVRDVKRILLIKYYYPECAIIQYLKWEENIVKGICRMGILSRMKSIFLALNADAKVIFYSAK